MQGSSGYDLCFEDVRIGSSMSELAEVVSTTMGIGNGRQASSRTFRHRFALNVTASPFRAKNPATAPNVRATPATFLSNPHGLMNFRREPRGPGGSNMAA